MTFQVWPTNSVKPPCTHTCSSLFKGERELFSKRKTLFAVATQTFTGSSSRRKRQVREARDGAHCPDALETCCLQSLPGLRGRWRCRSAGSSGGTGSAAAGQGNKMAAHDRGLPGPACWPGAPQCSGILFVLWGTAISFSHGLQVRDRRTETEERAEGHKQREKMDHQ